MEQFQFNMNSVKKQSNENKLTQKIGTDPNYKVIYIWRIVILFIFLHIGLFYGFYLFFYTKISTIIYTLFLAYISAEGALIGAHRFYSHRSFKAKWPLRLLLVTLQTISGQNSIYTWVRDHRLHHKYCDTDADPHNANRGFFFSHVGWLMAKQHPTVLEKYEKLDLSDIESDGFVMFQKRYFKILYLFLGFLIPTLIPYYCWNETLWNCLWVSYFLRYVFVLNGTWSINSVAHFYGTRPYDSTIKPVESLFVTTVTFGEGWHNYHHAYPWDYRAAESGIRYSASTALIDLCQFIGWAYDLRGTKEEMVKNRALKYGDGTHPVYKSNFLENNILMK